MFTKRPPYSNCNTEEVTEMPRCFSMSIQSETACLDELLPFTEPADWMVPL